MQHVLYRPSLKTPRDSASTDLEIARDVIDTEIHGLTLLSEGLNDSFCQVLDLINSINGRVIVTGMGKSGHVGRKMAAIFASTGTPSFFVHPAEASHGDLGMVTKDDCVIAISNGGEAPELKEIITYCKRFNIPLIAVTSKEKSSLGVQANLVLKLPQAPEACPLQKAPTTSALMTMALGDALAIALMKRRNFSWDDYKNFHPGGSLGGKLVKVEHIMRQGASQLPLVSPEQTIADVVKIMSAPQDFGVWGRAVIVDAEMNLLGWLSDGDLRRNLSHDLLDKRVDAVMNKNPLHVDVNAMAASALAMMNEKRIMELLVLENGRHVRGIIRMHDILAAGITV